MSTIDSPAIGTATINAVSVDCPAKTNLTLHVGPSHAEWGGRHELDTIYCAVGVYDTVTATRKAPGSGFSLNLEGAYLGDLASSGSDMRRNHAVLALFAMAEASGHEPDVALNIDKRIPVGAGMAGGSADAAATILALNTLWDLDWPIERLQEVAATLGADMPFCLTGGYARGTGLMTMAISYAILRNVGLPAICWSAHTVRNCARRKCMPHSIRSVPAMAMRTTCRRRRSPCIRVADRRSRKPCVREPARRSSPVPARPSSRSCRRRMRRTPCSGHGRTAVASIASSPRTPQPDRLCISPHDTYHRMTVKLMAIGLFKRNS